MLSVSAVFGHFDFTETAAQAATLARKAVELDDSFGWAYVALSLAFLLQRQHEKAIATIDEAIARQPNDADAHAYRGLILAFNGQQELGVEPVDQAIRLNPQFVNGPYLNIRGVIMAMAGNFGGAVLSFEENISQHGPIGPPVLAWITTAYWALGKQEDSERTADMLAARFPAFRLKNWNFLKLIRSYEIRRRSYDAMRAAGLPE